MNKIFKVIFSKALGRMVIVSEHAKGQGHGKTKSSKTIKKQAIAFHKVKIVKLLIVVSSLFLTQHIFAGNILQSISCPQALNNIRLIRHNGSSFTLLNNQQSAYIAPGENNSIAINSNCDQRNFVLSNAIGIGGSASDYGVALGYGALAYQAYNVAIGSQAKAIGKNSIALGADSVADRDNSFAVGSSTNLRQITSVAAGAQSTDAVNLGQIQGLLAGANIQTTVPAVMYSSTSSQNILLNGAGGTTISNLKAGIQATDAVNKKQMDDSIKIVDDKVTVLDGLKTLAVQYDNLASQDIVTLKGVNGTKLTNLQAGDISSASSTDAVTGGQLFSTNQNLENLDTRVTTEVTGLNTRIGNEVTNLDSKIQVNSTSITGLDGRVTTNETDIANLQLDQGTLSQLAVQYDTASQDVVTLKGVNGTKLTNLQAGDISSASSTDAVTGGQLFNTNQNLEDLDTRVTTEVTGLNTLIGNEVTNLDSKIQLNSTAITGLDGRVTTNETDIANLQLDQGTLNQLAVQYDTASQDVVTLKGVNGTKLTNLQAGDISSASSTDAVTGGQLFRTNQNLENLDTRVTTEVTGLNTRIGNEVTNLDSKIQLNSTAITGLDGRVTTNETDIANLQLDQGTLNQLAVQYDTASQDVVTLKGVNGTKLTNLQAGDISSASSTDAVTGGQLFRTNQNLENLDTRVTTEVTGLNTRIGNEVTNLDSKIQLNSTAITGLDGRVTTNETDIANLQLDQGTLNQLAVQYDTASQDVVTLKGVNGTKLTNLQAGDISSASSTDAVTGGQLFNTNSAITSLSGQFDSAMQQATSVLGGGSSYNNGVFVLPSYSIQGKNYSNVGDTFGAVNNEISALKTSVSDLKNYVDQQDQDVLGSANGYSDTQSTNALSNVKEYVDQQDAKTLSDANTYADQQTQQTLNVANGYTDQKTAETLANANAHIDDRIATSGQYININGAGGSGGGGSSSSGLNSTAIGPNTVVSGDYSTAVGVANSVSGNYSGAFGDPNIVTGNGSYVVGNDNTVSADNTFVLGNNVNATAKNSVALGNNSTLTRDNTVSVGSAENERQITYVADATEATDAVNLRQMQSANSETLSSSKTYTDTRVGQLESSFNDFSYQTERRFRDIHKQFDRQGAMSAAMMNMATSTSGLKGQNRVGVGAGFQGSEKAVAVGYQRMITENTSLSLGGAFTDEESSGGAGIGFSW